MLTTHKPAMPNPLYEASGPWWRFERYEIHGGYIRPAPGARLREYDPWEQYLKTRRRGGGFLDPPYQSLIGLLENVKGKLAMDGAGRPRASLSPESAASIGGWCSEHGLLGVLTHQIHLVALAPRWTQFPGDADAVCPSQVVHVRANYASCPFRTEENASGSLVTESVRKRAGDLLLAADRPSDSVPPGVFLNDLTTARWRQEPFGPTWARFFPGVPTSERETHAYPTPLTKAFWAQYAEPVGDFLQAATMFRDVVSRLAGGGRSMSRKGRAAELHRGLETLHGVVAPVSPALAISADGHLQQRWVGPSLLSAFAMMVVADLGGKYRIYVCDACNRPFPSGAYQARYCSLRCRGRLQMQRYRKGIRERRAAQSKRKAPRPRPRSASTPGAGPHGGR